MRTAAVPIVDRITDAFVELDGDFRFTYLNPGAERLLERPREELMGRVIWDEFPETARTEFPEALHRAQDEQVPLAFEVYHRPRKTWYEVRVYPDPEAMTVLFRDVTERRDRETDLAQFAAVVESMHAAVVTLDDQNRIVRVNGSVESTLGVDRSELVGEHVEVIPERAGVDPADTVDIGRAISDVAVGAQPYTRLEVPFVDDTGTRRIGEVRIVSIDDDTATVAGIVRDVTERYEHERVVTGLHELTRWLVDAEDPVEICSIAVHAGSELLELPLTGVWLLDDEHGCLEPVASTAESHEVVGGLPRFNPGEGLVWEAFDRGEACTYDDLHEVEGRYRTDTPLRSEIIAPIGTHGVLMTGAETVSAFDETDEELVSILAENTRAALDRAERERALRTRTQQLDRQSERLEAVADVLATDLSAQLELVAEAVDDSAGWEFPLAEDTVLSTLERAESLVQDVRDFSAIAAQLGPRSRVDLETVVAEVCESSDHPPDRVTLVQNATLRADMERFQRLVRTALACLDGEGMIRIQPTGGESPTLAFVGDDSPVTTDGLGLSLVQAIAEAHGWTVSIAADGRRIELGDVTTLEVVD